MPRRADHDAQRRRVAEATWRVIGERGYDGATVREIARAAGCSTGTLSHYFRNRHELIAFTFDQVVADLTSKVEARAAAEPPGLPRLQVVIEEFLPVEGDSDATATMTLSAWSQAGGDRALAEQHRTNHDHLRRLAARYTAEAIAAGHLPADTTSAEDAADLLISFADGLCLGCLLEPDRFTAARRANLTGRFLTLLSYGDGGHASGDLTPPEPAYG